jgi:hypothetical protein
VRIHNIRLGHACNSSSTHSIVPLAALGSAEDKYTPGEFGWDRFVLASADAKMRYLAAQLGGVLPPSRVTEVTGIEPYVYDYYYGPFGYVDHQSVLGIPVVGEHADLFLRELVDYLRRDDVVILGGNDNGNPPAVAGRLPLPWEGFSPLVFPGIREDGGRYWTMIDRVTGDKIRFSFDGQPLRQEIRYGGWDEDDDPKESADFPPYEPREPRIGSFPELVDMKVTDYCPFSCEWCYMGSTREGKPAGTLNALEWLDALVDAGVMEIALGGGEPTLWGGLPAFLDRAKERSVNVNLTTKNLKWLEDDRNHGLRKMLRAIAVSVNNEKDLAALRGIIQDHLGRTGEACLYKIGYSGSSSFPELTIQCVPAFLSRELLKDVIRTAHEFQVRVTFLGVKRTGRAAEEKRVDDLQWLEILKEEEFASRWLARNIAIDTLMAASAEPVFREMGISPVFYGTEEGAFSFYVDAVTQQTGPSSYQPELLAPLTDSSARDWFLDAQRRAGLRSSPW